MTPIYSRGLLVLAAALLGSFVPHTEGKLMVQNECKNMAISVESVHNWFVLDSGHWDPKANFVHMQYNVQLGGNSGDPEERATVTPAGAKEAFGPNAFVVEMDRTGGLPIIVFASQVNAYVDIKAMYSDGQSYAVRLRPLGSCYHVRPAVEKQNYLSAVEAYI